ncbi:MAG: type III polyketide synthase [Chitinophagaceae bacterium]|nr:MAG: type III polyketide synthase [Chitinophagaceae bacterium]
MTKILAVGTAVPIHAHAQNQIMDFMQRVYALDETGNRKLRYLYRQGGIHTRYSVIPDYSLPAADWQFFPASENLEPFPNLDTRMAWYKKHAATLSLSAIDKCLADHRDKKITHLITVSCTGMSAPGLDIELIRAMGLPPGTHRQSINFMGCYAAVHALKMADAFCKADATANVLIVCTELCTLHFQKESSPDSITSSMLFGDGSAAVLVSGNENAEGIRIDHFYGIIADKGIDDMSWQLSTKGFLMTLSSYVPALIEEDFGSLVDEALSSASVTRADISNWCIHPGGKKILEAVSKSMGLADGSLDSSYEVLEEYGNMSSPTILFVLDKMINGNQPVKGKIFGAAFGPGLTMETFILSA